MAIANKIVDTRRLAAKGRFGDTEIRNVRGRPSHVNAYEAYLMDTAGINPSASGRTTHPETSLDEYWFHDKVGDYLTKTYKNIDVLAGGLLPGGVESIFKGGDFWFGEESLWGKATGKKKKRLIEEQAGGIMTGGMENLQTQYGQYMGDEGFLEREEDIREKGLKDVYDVTMGKYDIAGKELSESTTTGYKKVKEIGDVQRSRSNLVYSDTIEQKVEEAEIDVGKKYTLGMENIALGKTGAKNIYDVGMEASALTTEKGEADFMAGLRKQMNIMMTDYLSATGEAYGDTGAGSMWEQLDTLFDTYSSNV